MSSKFSSALVVTVLLSHTVLAPLTAVAQEQDASPQQVQGTTVSNESVEAMQKEGEEPIDDRMPDKAPQDTSPQQVQGTTDSTLNESVEAAQRAGAESIDDWMPDKALQAVIAEKLNTAVSAITKESMLRLSKELYLGNTGITDISGLEYAKNIFRVELDQNIGLDESSLQNTFSKMPNVTVIGVRDCQLQNIDWVSNLTWLTTLDIGAYRTKGQITSLEPLENLTHLNFLNMIGNKISDLTPLQNLNLNTFWGADNPYSDVTPLKNSDLHTFDVRNTNVEDISILKGKRGGGYFAGAKISDLSPANGYTIWSAENQRVTLPPVYVLNKQPYSVSVSSPIKDAYSKAPNLTPQTSGVWTGIYTGSGSYSGKVDWIGGNQVPEIGDLVSTWSVTRTNKQGHDYTFSGTYTQPYILSKATITAHNSTVYVGDNWNPIDNFDSALDHEGNPLDFSKITVTGTVNTSRPGVYPIVYGYEGLEEKVEVTVEGKVEFSVPTNISFGTHQLARGTNYFSPENLQKPLTVTDTRGIGNSWKLSAKLQSELTNGNGKTLPNAVVYKENSSEKTITIANSQLIASKTTTEQNDITEVSENWSNNQGLLVKVNEGEAFRGEYTGVIEWTLADAP